VPGVPLMVNLSEAGDHSALPPTRVLAECGVALMIYPVGPLLSAAGAVAESYRSIRRTGASGRSQQDWRGFTDLLGVGAELATDAEVGRWAKAQLAVPTTTSIETETQWQEPVHQ
jgi:2-methylisocitrate lyase-like PEP mutase family enzyme